MPRVVAGYREEARKTVLDAAVGVFAERGYHDTTMDDVAQKLGVSKGAVYQYFDSKEELFRTICSAAADMVRERLRTTFAGPDLRKAAENYMNAELDKLAKRGVLMFEALAHSPRDEALAEVLRNNYSMILGIMSDHLDELKASGVLRRGMESRRVAKQLIALRHGVLTTVLQGQGREEVLNVWMDGFDSIMKGYLVPRSS